MESPINWEREWELEKSDKIEPISGQLSFFSADKTSFFKSSEKRNNIFSSFEDIIYKNPAYTVAEMQKLTSLSEEMDG